MLTPTRSLKSHFLSKLTVAQEQRDDLYREVPTKYDPYPVPEWVVHERQVMYGEVLSERAKIGKGETPFSEVLVAEGQAKGHSDYSSKFAFYCAELVLK